MPGKKSGGFAKILAEYLKVFVNEAVSFFFSAAEKRLKKYAVSLMLMVSSLAVVIYGLGSFLGYFFPSWIPGTSHIIAGLLIFLASIIYLKQ